MDVVIRNARLIDGTAAAPVPRVSAEVANGVISWIGEESARPKRRIHREDISGEGTDSHPGADRLPRTLRGRWRPGHYGAQPQPHPGKLYPHGCKQRKKGPDVRCNVGTRRGQP